MDLAILIVSLTCLVVTVWVSRSLSWAVLALAVSISAAGVLINLAIDLGARFSRSGLQLLLVLALAIPAAIVLARRPTAVAPRRRQLLGIGVPVVVASAFLVVATTFWTAPEPAFLQPVSFLIGHGTAEDNAKWLDFAAKLATGAPVEQLVPMGGPLQLVMTFWATAMGVVSQVLLGGYNEVAVAANSVIAAQFGFVALAPLALAPLAEMRLGTTARQGRGRAERIPAPALWIGSVTLMAAVLVVTGYGHLTFQYSLIIAAIWAATFAASMAPRWRLLSTLVMAAGMTVWLPLNVLAIGLLAGVLIVLLRRAMRGGWRSVDPLVAAVWIVVVAGIWQPLRSSISFVLNSGGASATEASGAVARGVAALVSPAAGPVRSLLDGVGLFASPGGTEPIGPVLAVLAAAAVVAAAVVVLRSMGSLGTRLLPLGILAGYASGIYALDAWVTGSAPNYGSLKFGFLVVVVAAAVFLPLAVCAADRGARRMTALRWGVVLGGLLLLMVDTLLPRSIAAARPEQWSPPLPYSNERSWWWPAEVNGTGTQPISANPIGCVYLPNGAKAPSAILESQLSGGDRVYACSRILAGLAGADTNAQPFVDWLRAEWLMNTPAWDGKRGYLAEMSEAVRRQPVILLDDLSNVIGVEPLDSLLQRFPARQ